MNALVTGCAGFIGYHLTMRLLNDGYNVVGIDNISDYYDVRLKNDRLKILIIINRQTQAIIFSNRSRRLFKFSNIFKTFNPEVVINLAAQAG